MGHSGSTRTACQRLVAPDVSCLPKIVYKLGRIDKKGDETTTGEGRSSGGELVDPRVFGAPDTRNGSKRENFLFSAFVSSIVLVNVCQFCFILL
jgi:hypothetical protein